MNEIHRDADEELSILVDHIKDRRPFNDLFMGMEHQLKRQYRMIEVQRTNGKVIEDVADEVHHLCRTMMQTKDSWEEQETRLEQRLTHLEEQRVRLEQQQSRLEQQQSLSLQALIAVDQKLTNILSTDNFKTT